MDLVWKNFMVSYFMNKIFDFLFYENILFI